MLFLIEYPRILLHENLIGRLVERLSARWLYDVENLKDALMMTRQARENATAILGT